MTNPGFQSKYFRVATLDGRNVVLLQDVVYISKSGITYILPAGATSDGASTPPEIWLTLPPFGSYWQAAYLHDTAYRNTLLLADRTSATLTFEQSNDLLLEAMELAGTHDITRTEIYEGVALGGRDSFDSDRAQGTQAFMIDLATLD